MKSKFIVPILILGTFVILVGIFFWLKERKGPIYIPITSDLENCIIEEIGTPTPYQKICLNKEYPLPAKVYFENGWRAICCSK